MRATPKLANKVSRCAPFLPNHLESPTLFWVFPYPRLQSSAPMAQGLLSIFPLATNPQSILLRAPRRVFIKYKDDQGAPQRKTLQRLPVPSGENRIPLRLSQALPLLQHHLPSLSSHSSCPSLLWTLGYARFIPISGPVHICNFPPPEMVHPSSLRC